MPRIWTVGILADTPSLFPADGFDAERSAELLQRVQSLPAETIDGVSGPLRIGRAWAALLIADNDHLWRESSLREDRLSEAVEALNNAVAARQATTSQATQVNTGEAASGQ